MTQTPSQSTGTLWARFRFSVWASLPRAPRPPRCVIGDPLPCREDLVSSRDRTRRPVLGCHHRAMVLPAHRVEATTQSRSSAGCAQRPRQGDSPLGSRPAALAPVSRPSALELPVALRQPRRTREGRSFAEAAVFVLHGPAVHACSRLGPRPRLQAEGTTWRGGCGDATPDAGDPQL